MIGLVSLKEEKETLDLSLSLLPREDTARRWPYASWEDGTLHGSGIIEQLGLRLLSLQDCENKCLLFKVPCSWHFILATQADCFNVSAEKKEEIFGTF